MSDIDLRKMERQLVLHEGIRLVPYRCTADKQTIAVGYNMQDRGLEDLEASIGRPFDGRLTRDEALKVCRDDIVEQRDACLQLACYTAAAYHMADSLWAHQVDDGLAGDVRGRADRLCRMMVTGTDPFWVNGPRWQHVQGFARGFTAGRGASRS
jgi:lysozyme